MSEPNRPTGRLPNPMAVTTSVEPLEGNKVRLHVAVPAADFERAIDAAFRKLAREVKMPGFRPGKAPRRLLEARLGTEVARDQALRDSLPEYYAEAVVAESIDVIAPPEIDITAGEDDGDVEFDAVVEVRPEVTRRGPRRAAGRDPDARRRPTKPIDAPGRHAARALRRPRGLERAAHRRRLRRDRHQGLRHDESIEGLTATDYLYEVGSGIVVPELDDELRGKRPGDILKFNADAPRALRRARRRRGVVPGARQGDQAEGAPRAHRRVGRRR